MDNIIIVATAGGSIAKIFIDILRMGVDMPRWLPPLLALIVSPALVVLFQVAAGVALTTEMLATCALAGILAAGYAVGATELSKRGETGPMVPHG